jgi:tetratricopeptide (TPR) repeat protein
MRKIPRIFILSFTSVSVTAILFAQTEAQSFISILDSAREEYSKKNWHKAATLWEQVTTANPVDGYSWEYLAAAYYNDKAFEKAIPAYQKLVELGFGVPANHAYNVACCYSLIKNKQQSLFWLRKAMNLGYYYVAHAQTDTDLDFIAGDQAFKDLLFLKDVNKMTRNEGWLYDLDMLQWEVKRKVIHHSFNQDLPSFYASLGRLRKEIPRLSDAQIIIELMKAVRFIGDGHSNIFLPTSRPEFKQTLPVQFYFFEEGLFIISSDPKYKELLGSQVLQFENKKVYEVINSLDPLIGRDNKMNVMVRLPYLMRHPILLQTLGLISNVNQVALRIKNQQGEEKTVSIMADTLQPDIWNIQPYPKGWISYPDLLTDSMPLYLRNNDKTFWFEYISASRIVYAQVNRIRNTPEESLTSFERRLSDFINENDVAKLVIDLRGNNGGNTFSGWDFVNELSHNSKINRKGHLFVIIGRRTFSAAQNTATYFERLTNAIFVGEPTGSRPNFVGDEAPIKLPYSHIELNVSGVLWQSSWGVDNRTWIAPLLYVPPTIKDYIKNRDGAMETIANYKID